MIITRRNGPPANNANKGATFINHAICGRTAAHVMDRAIGATAVTITVLMMKVTLVQNMKKNFIPDMTRNVNGRVIIENESLVNVSL